MLVRLGQLGYGVEFVYGAIDAHASETLCTQFGKKLKLFALAVGDHGCQDHQLGFSRQRQYVIDHLRYGLRFQRLVVVRAVGRAGAGVEQA